MRPFDYIAPDSAEKALAVLAEKGKNAKLLAGGTDLLVELKNGPEVPEIIVDLSRIAEFKGIEETDEGLRIGSLVTHTEIMDSDMVARHAPAMIDAARTIGAVQTRNLGTLGGNLVTCVPSLDSGPVLVALDAIVGMAGPKGRKQMPIVDFFVGPRKTALEPGELLADIVIPRTSLGKSCVFAKFGLRKGQALALVNVAAAVEVDKKTGALAETRIALGAVAPVVIRTRKAEAMLDGEKPDEALLAQAADIAAGEARPIDDFRASAAYRRELIRALTRRVLDAAIKEASSG